MKRLLILLLPLLILACSEKNDAADNGGQSFSPNELMSEGNPNDLGSKYDWKHMRLANPETGMIPANIRKKELAFAASLPANYAKAYNWDKRGPVNVGGRTRAIAFDVLNDSIWLAGGVTGGIWRSEDAGDSWYKVTGDLQLHSVTSIAQDTRAGHEDTWYAGTGEHYAIVSQTTFEARFSGNGVMKSTDNGLTWMELPATTTNTPETYLTNGDMDFVWRMAIDPSDAVNDVVLAAVYNGVQRSADGGDTWSQVLGFNTGGFSNPASDNLDLVVTSTGVFYATLSSDGPDKGIYRSDDGGLTWTDIIPTGFPGSYGRLTIAINPLDENVIWIFGGSSSGYANNHGIYRYQFLSGDGSGAGGAWSDRSANLPDVTCNITGLTTNLGQLSTQGSFDVHIAVHPTDTNVIYIAGTSIWRNTDGFTHDSTNAWIGGYYCDPTPYDDLDFSYIYENHHPDQHYLTFLPSDSSILVNVNDGGVYQTMDDMADTVQWTSKNNGFVTSQFYGIAIEPGDATSDIVIGGLQDNGTWFTNTAEFDSTWKFIGLGDGMYCALTNGADYFITSKQNGRLYIKEIDANGNVLSHERIDPTGGPSSYNWANSLKLDPSNDKRIFWNGKNRLWRLDDISAIPITGDRVNKQSGFWEVIEESTIHPSAATITDIEMCESDSNTVWFGTVNAVVYRLDTAYEDLGAANLVDISGPDFPQNAYVSCVAVNPYDSDRIIVTFANYGIPSVFWTTDGGQNWMDVSGNLEENPDGSGSGPAVFWAEYYVDETIFIGTSTGLYTSNFLDSTNTVWTLEPGVGNVSVDHMDYRTSDGYFVVGTHGQGIFSTHLTPGYVGVNEEDESGLSVYPTLATDLVNVMVPEEAKQLEVYSLSGQRVYQTNLNGNTQIDVSGFQAGTYIVVVRNGNEKWTQKVMKR